MDKKFSNNLKIATILFAIFAGFLAAMITNSNSAVSVLDADATGQIAAEVPPVILQAAETQETAVSSNITVENLAMLAANPEIRQGPAMFDIADINELRIYGENVGSTNIRKLNTIDTLRVLGSFTFSEENGVLTVHINPNSFDLTIFLPNSPNSPDLPSPVFDSVHIETPFSGVRITGENGIHFAENMTIISPYNWTTLSDIKISGELNLSTNFIMTRLTNVDVDHANVTTEFNFDGQVMDSWPDFGQIVSRPSARAARAALNEPPTPSLGLMAHFINEEMYEMFSLPMVGVVIVAVFEGGAADAAGLMAGDIIGAFNRMPIATVEDLITAIERSEIGETVVLSVLRGGVVGDFSVVVGSSLEIWE